MKKLILGLVLGMLIGSATVAFAASDLAGTEVKAIFASFNLVINGETKQLDAVPLVYNGTSYLPVKDIANLTGFDVTYKADSRTIELNKNEKVVSNMTIMTTANETNQAIVVSKLTATDLVGVLYKKYNLSDIKDLSIVPTSGKLTFKDEVFQLVFVDETNLDITPLLEKNILTQDDISSFYKSSSQKLPPP